MPDKGKEPLNLSQFTGTTTWFRHKMFRRFTYTDGVQYLAQEAGAYWLIDAILSHQLDPLAQAEPFQNWTLTVRPDATATLAMTDGNGEQAIIRQEIPFTDFPLPEISLWFENNLTLLLPSEH
jgi:hypothetical protein